VFIPSQFCSTSDVFHFIFFSFKHHWTYIYPGMMEKGEEKAAMVAVRVTGWL